MGSTSVSRPGGPTKPTRRPSDHAAPQPPPENPRTGQVVFPGAGSVGGDAGANPASPPAAARMRPLAVDGRGEDAALRRAGFLSREEVLRRRLRRARQLAGYYRRQYWGLMDAVRVRHRDYYWNFGRSPMEGAERGGGGEQNGAAGAGAVEGSGESGRVDVGFGAGEVGGNRKRDRERCGIPGCKTKPMALTRYCHLHILADQKQKLYKACAYPIKSMQTGPVTCGKPVLRAQVLSYCPNHIQKAQKNVSQALKKAGLSQSSNRPLPRIHVIIAECVRQIQAKRTEAQMAAVKQNVDEEEAAIQTSCVG